MNMQAREKLKAGIVGLGHQSLDDHVPAILASSDVDLVAVADIDEERLQSFSQDHREIHTYRQYKDLLKKERLDFIIVAVPHYLHYDVVMEAVKRKIHVLKEKPCAVTLAQAKKIKRCAESNNAQIMLALQRRFDPTFRTFFKLIDKIGNPFFIEAKYTFYVDSPHEGWRSKKKLAGGGCLMDMGYHVIDLLIWYFGLPDLVFTESSCVAKEGVSYDAEDTAQIIFRFSKQNIFGSLLISRVVPPKQEYFDVYGTRGIIHIERGKIERRASNGEIQEVVQNDYNHFLSVQNQLEYFVQVIRGEKEKSMTNLDLHFNHLAFIEAAYRSKEGGEFFSTKTILNENDVVIFT